VYCGNADHKTLGYLAADEDRDARRAETCTRCRGYLKAVATLGALDPSEVLVRDASTVEFDVAALDQEFARPQTPAYSLQVSVQPATKENRWSVENR
jgi:formate dehydrogenase maturation protein FdhE